MSLSDDQVKEMLAQLKEHFKEPVRPVSEYCNAFRDWHDAISKKLQEDLDDYEKKRWTGIREALVALEIPISKSNYLWRRLYGDGLHRTVKCPEHKGRWSGYAWMEDDYMCPHGCMHGYDQTGWLPDPHPYLDPPPDIEPILSPEGKVLKMGVRYVQTRCYKCGGKKEAEIHNSSPSD